MIPGLILNVIIPIRNRDKELNKLKINLSKIFKEQGITPIYYIVYQDDNLEFNKGMLSNIGFLIAEKYNFSNHFLFNDVTVYPLSSSVYNYNFKLDNDVVYNPYGYLHCLARFFLINHDTFLKINGYSNKYYGWGYEDTDLQNRILYKNIKINRDIFWLRENDSKTLLNSDKFQDTIKNIKQKMNKASKTTKKIYNNIWNNSNIKNIGKVLDTDGLSSLSISKHVKYIEREGNCIKIYVIT